MRARLFTFSAVMLATLLTALDQTILTTALPRIVADLQGFEHLSWVVTSYLVASTVTIPLYGRLSDVYGRRPLLVAAISLFVLGSLLCGIASSMPQLIAFRALQGLGAGGLIPLAQATVGDLFPPRERGRYLGYVSSMWGVAAIAGPLVGGTLTDAVSWRWIFLMNIPLGLFALLVVVRTMPDPGIRREHRIDYAGATVLAASISAILLASVWGGTTYPWGSPQVIGCAVAGVAGLVAFVMIERRAAEPLLPLSLFRGRVVAVCAAASAVIGAIVFAVTIYMPIYLQGVRGDTATESGLTLLGFAIGWVVSGIVAGRMTTHTGRYAVWPRLGAVLALAGVVGATQVDASSSLAFVVLATTLLGIGMGLSVQAYVVATQNAVPPAQLGTATAALTFSRNIGSSLAVAGFGAILANRLAAELAARLGPGAHAVSVDDLVRGTDLPVGLVTTAQGALVDALHSVYVVTVGLAVVGVILAFALEERRLRSGAPEVLVKR